MSTFLQIRSRSIDKYLEMDTFRMVKLQHMWNGNPEQPAIEMNDGPNFR